MTDTVATDTHVTGTHVTGTAATYPHLGFNPVPGVPEDVRAIASALRTATASLKESGALLTQVRDAGSEVWQGQAGDAFRSHVDGALDKRLSTAQTSLETALGIFHDWHADLVGFTSSAAKLDAEAAAARQAVEQAATRLATARADPAFQLVGRTLTGAALRQAQQAVTAAQHTLDAADRAVTDARDDLDAVIGRARELESQHEAVARRFAQALDHAASDLAPHKPGMFSRMWNDVTSGLDAVGSWVKGHLDAIHSVLSAVSAIAGLVALLTPPPIDAIALGVSLVAGAGALAVDAANPETRKGISELLHGHVNKESLGAAGAVLGDALSVVPGATVAAKAGFGALKAGDAAAEALPTVGELATAAARNPGKLLTSAARVKFIGKGLTSAKLIAEDTTEALGRSVATVADKAAKAADIADSMKRLNVVWHAKSLASRLKHDVTEAVS